MWDEKDWPKNSDSPTVQKALSIETLKAENAALRERLTKEEDANRKIMNAIIYASEQAQKLSNCGCIGDAFILLQATIIRALLASEDQEKT